jgi:sugar transferase (PEP-CTERM/EpsH1 system associated)
VWKPTEEFASAPWAVLPESKHDASDQPNSAMTKKAVSARPHAGTLPLRVLHVLNRLDTGGTEHVVLNLVEELDTELFEQQLCVTRGFNPELVRARGLLREPYVAGKVDGGNHLLVFRLARIIRSARPHIVHSRNWGAIESIFAARIAGVPIVIHSEHGYEVDMAAGLPKRRRLLRRGAYPLADAIFTVSEELRDYHAKQAWISPDQIRVISNGVDAKRFSPCRAMRPAMRQKLGLSADSFVVGSVGRMVAIKDYGTLLTAVENLASRGMNVQVLLAGSGPELESHRAAVARSSELAGQVTFLGTAENVPEVMNAMDVFVLPSLLEGMSNTILEAMACGLPVLATSVGGNPELVEDGVSGWLFGPGNVSDLAMRIEQFASNGEMLHKFGAAARDRVVNRFSLDRMISNYQSLYLELAAKRGLVSFQDL